MDIHVHSDAAALDPGTAPLIPVAQTGDGGLALWGGPGDGSEPGAGWRAETALRLAEQGYLGDPGVRRAEPAAAGVRIFTGIGPGEGFGMDGLRAAIAGAVRTARSRRAAAVSVDLTALPAGVNVAAAAQAVAEGALLGGYRFDRYRTGEDAAFDGPTDLHLIAGDEVAAAETGAHRGAVAARATNRARNLVNTPANDLDPAALAAAAVAAAEGLDVEVEVRERDGIEALGMEAFLSVARAAESQPRLIVMRYRGQPGSDETVALVGKGITYDTGGLSLKPTAGMLTMKTDMAGSAAVIAAVAAAAELELPINATAVVAACENAVDGRAYRPGDVIGSMAGKTIEIHNTDAEGRLTLADAVHYAVHEEGATAVVDVATLTGAAKIALGLEITPVLASDDALYERLAAAAEQTGEKVWRLPADPAYRKLLNSTVADLKNTGGRPAGTITAGLFIREFLPPELPWLHLDIAGTGRAEKVRGYHSRGGTGVPTRTLIELLETMASGA